MVNGKSTATENKNSNDVSDREKMQQVGEDLNQLPVQKGLVGVVVDETEICSVDGILGKLYYRGYAINELVKNSNFEEVAFLLLFGKLPSKFELSSFKERLVAERNIPDRICN